MPARTINTSSGPKPAPIKINSYEEYTDLLTWYKQLLVPHLPPLAQGSLDRTVKRTTISGGKVTTTYVTPEEAGFRVISQGKTPMKDQLSHYTLAKLWSTVVKHWSAQLVADLSFGERMVRKWGRRVRMAFQKDDSGVMILLGGGASIKAGSKEVTKWISMDKYIEKSLPKKDKKEWRLLCGLIVASDGGKLLALDLNNVGAGSSTATASASASVPTKGPATTRGSATSPANSPVIGPGSGNPESSQGSVISCHSETDDDLDATFSARAHFGIPPNPRPFSYAGTTANDIIREVQRRGRMIYREE